MLMTPFTITVFTFILDMLLRRPWVLL